VLVLLALGALAAAPYYLIAVRPDRRSIPYRRAMEKLRANASAVRLLGQPVEAGWWVRGRAGADSAKLAVPVGGPQREGVLRAEAQRAGDGWVISHLDLTVGDAGGLRMNLLSRQDRRRDAHGDSARPPSLRVPPRYRE
jgi:hypothetical protein